MSTSNTRKENMKKIKNNKGVTGVDVALSITIIVIVLGVVLSAYSNYSNRTKQVNRNARATNLVMKVIENIEANDELAKEIIKSEYDIIITQYNKETYGIDNLPNGYNLEISKAETTGDTTLDVVATKIIVTASYKIENEEKNVSLDIIKLKDIWNKEAQEPPVNEEIKAQYTAIKYDVDKNGYVVTTFDDPDWYSISSKRFATRVKNVVETENGTVDLEQCTEIHVWIPTGIEDDDGSYRYVIENSDESYSKIIYSDENNICSYKKGDKVTTTIYGGEWYELNENLEVVNKDLENVYNVYINRPFTWEKPVE